MVLPHLYCLFSWQAHIPTALKGNTYPRLWYLTTEIKCDFSDKLKKGNTYGKGICLFLLKGNLAMFCFRIPGVAIWQIKILAGRYTGNKHQVLVICSLYGQIHILQSI